MENKLALFSFTQGNLLIRLLVAHIISDFVFQPAKMVENKKWASKYMALHVFIVFTSTLLLSFELMLSIILTLIHWIIDSIKVFLLEKNTKIEKELFIADQTLHIITILVLWFTYFNMWNLLTVTITIPFTNYNFSLLLLAYLWLIYPVSFLMKYVSQSIAENINPTPKNNDVEKEHGGKKIGQFERVIILTLVLLKQYEAIGFLITGKSIIRFADHNSNLRSEYVLVGTMMSYAIAILTGVCVNYLLSN